MNLEQDHLKVKVGTKLLVRTLGPPQIVEEITPDLNTPCSWWQRIIKSTEGNYFRYNTIIKIFDDN